MKFTFAILFVFATGLVSAQVISGADDTVIVSRKTAAGIFVTGKVTDAATKKPAAGVRLQVEDFSATITDSSGKFKLKVPSYDATVLVLGEGFNDRQIPLKGRQSFDVALLDDSHVSFSEEVTLPMGKKTKKYTTASVGQYNVDGWSLNSSEAPDAILQGRIAGLNATRRSGTPGAGANLLLRGYNSLYATNKPLIIIDNMLYDANDYGQSIIANNYTNPLALIDNKDIDNITVLRDASSIYGSRGANGAIIITTARAKEQATKIDFGAFTGFNIAPTSLPVMQAGSYRTYLSEILQSQGMTTSQIAAQPYMNDDVKNPDYTSYHFNTDWQKKVFENSMSNNYFLKVTGGDNIATYGLSMGYTKSQGVVKTTDMTRFNMRFNAEFNFSKRFTGYTNLSFAYNEQRLKDQGIANKTSPVYVALIKSPFLHDHDVNSEGIESPNLADKDILGISNPSAIIEKMLAYNKYYRFYGAFGFKYGISKNWSANTILGVVYDKVRENIFVPSVGISKDTLSNAIANNRLGTQVKRLFTIYNDTRIEYNKAFGHTHKLNARLGLRYQKNSAEQDYALGFNSATNELISVQNGLPALRQVGGGIGDWNWMNTYLNVDYGFKNKVFLTFNMAMDGSSRFGKQAKNGIAINGNKFPVLPSLSAAWLISSENFMANSAINLLKLRATYGISGNDDIGNFSSRQTYGSQNLLGLQGLVRNGIANTALQWENSTKLNAGLDVAFWNERMSISMDAFSSKTTNMLVYENIGAATGFDNVLTNNGSMKNTGIEVTVNARVVNTAKVKWDLGFNVSQYKNQIIAVPSGQFTTDYAGATILTANGQAGNQFYGYTSNGVFSTSAEAAAAGLRKLNANGSYSMFMAGDVRFADLNGDKIIDENDRSVIGDPNPTFTGGITNRVSWKRFELNALFTYSQGNDIYNYLRNQLEASSGYQNQLISVNNRWRNDGQVTNAPKATWGDPMGNSRFSNRWIEDGSYFRLRSISLQYYIPFKKGMVNNATIYVTGTNLLTLTKYKGYDPEFSASPSIFAQGIDTGLEPIYKNVTFGVRIGL
ncbi:MAG: SusC/RagA family TonB-linked outer membrane protein [Ferruginibacter sp.]